MNKDVALISEAYMKIVKEAYGKSYGNDSKSSDWDGEIRIHRDPRTGKYSSVKYRQVKANPELHKNDINFYVTAKYDLDFSYEEGDYYSPPDLTITNIDINDYSISMEDPETGESRDVSNELEKTNPELFKAVMDGVDEEISSFEYEHLR